MDFSPFSLLVVKVFSLITGGLGAEACAQILKVPLEELAPIIAELKEGGLLQSDPDRPARIMITSRGVAELQMGTHGGRCAPRSLMWPPPLTKGRTSKPVPFCWDSSTRC